MASSVNPLFSQPQYQTEDTYADAYSGPSGSIVPLSCSADHDKFSARKQRSSRHIGTQFQNSPRAAKIKPVIEAEKHPEPFRDYWRNQRDHYARPASIAPNREMHGSAFIVHEPVKPLPWRGSESVYISPGGKVVTIPTRNAQAISAYCSLEGPSNNARLKHGVGGDSPRQMGVVCAPPKKGATGAAGAAGSLRMTFPNGQSRHQDNDYGKQEQLRDHMAAPSGRHRPNGEGTRGLGVSPRRGQQHETKGPFLRSIRHPQVLDPGLIYEDAAHARADAEAQRGAEDAARHSVKANRPKMRFLSVAEPTVGAAFYASKLQGAMKNRPHRPGDDPYKGSQDMFREGLRAEQEKKSKELAEDGKGIFKANYTPGKDFKTYGGTSAKSMGGERRRAVGMFHPSQRVSPASHRGGAGSPRSPRVGKANWDLFNYRSS